MIQAELYEVKLNASEFYIDSRNGIAYSKNENPEWHELQVFLEFYKNNFHKYKLTGLVSDKFNLKSKLNKRIFFAIFFY